jgi:NAD(P)H-dependent flavin oxidoreductase YrpB (nitropropane dioxygenase family)
VRTPICERLEIEFPIFAFSHCRDVVAAVSRAGGFGVLGALAFNPEELEIELSWIDEHVDSKPDRGVTQLGMNCPAFTSSIVPVTMLDRPDR